MTGETISIRFKYETVVTTNNHRYFQIFQENGVAGHYGVVTFNSSLPGKCSPWSQDRLQFIIFAPLFSPYIVVTQSIACTIYGGT